jgi:uncharacterized ubiquitin-like protein YukD
MSKVTVDMTKVNQAAYDLVLEIVNEAWRVAEANHLNYTEFRLTTYEMLMNTVANLNRVLVEAHNKFLEFWSLRGESG